MDEIAPAGLTSYWEVRGGQVSSGSIDPASFGLGQDDVAALAGGDPAANASRVRRLLSDPAADPVGRAAVILNAGAAVYVAGLEPDLAAAMQRAAGALEDGAAAAALERLRDDGAVSTSG
jgi:anthranilate phosphoribosyltransferase